MAFKEFKSNDTLKKLWWLHDSFWHAAIIRELGVEQANKINLEVSEKVFRMMAITLLREKVIQRPQSIQDLMSIFQTVWWNAFFEELYVNDPIEYNGNTAIWAGTRCHAYDSLRRAKLTGGYDCGCQALRNGVMKALKLKPLHRIKESLIGGDSRCVIEVTFEKNNDKALL